MTLAHAMVPVMNVALVLGVAFVLPRALQPLGRRTPFLVAALGVAGSLLSSAGPLAASLLAPWVLLTLAVALCERAHFWRLAAAGFSLTAALALVASRLEVTLFDIPEPIVKLTALHFTYAGAGTLTLARRLHLLRPSRWTSVTQALVLVAPPLVAAGFVFRSAAGQVGGAALMTLGVWLVAALQVRDVREGPRRVAWLVSSLSPLVAMVLAVAWAANQYWAQVPALTVPDMVPTHGALNAFGFVACGLFAADGSAGGGG